MRMLTARVFVCGMVFATSAGCSTITDTLGISPPSHKLLDAAKTIRDTAPVPAPVGRELAKELLPTHLVQQGDTLVIQPVELDSPIRLPPEQTVQTDGAIDLGKYGRPVVVGKTVPQIETLVQDIIKDQEKKAIGLTVRLVGKPSDVYYVFGEINAPGSFPISGRETVMDGIVAAGGLSKKASAENIILSRPTAPDGCRIVLPVCWREIVQLGDTTTNYQLLPGDRIYVPGKGPFEGFCPSRDKKLCPACCRPQYSCFGGGCVGGCNPSASSSGSQGMGLSSSNGATGAGTSYPAATGTGMSRPSGLNSGNPGISFPSASSLNSGMSDPTSTSYNGHGMNYNPTASGNSSGVTYSGPATSYNGPSMLPTVPQTPSPGSP